MQVALDSQVYSYLIDGWKIDGPSKTDPLYEEKLALARMIFYFEETLALSETVRAEYERIHDASLRKEHQEFILVTFVGGTDPRQVDTVAAQYSKLHPGRDNYNDCKIVAEAEICKCDVVLTFDDRLIRNLKGKTISIRILKPLEFWHELDIPKGSRPPKRPREDNPLAQKTWWLW